MNKPYLGVGYGWHLLALVIMLSAATTAVGDVRTWIGAGENAQSSTAANWQDNNPPENGDSVLFANAHLGNAHTNVTWDLEIDIQDWTQTVDYTGTITIQTKYPDRGFSFTNLTITGDATLEGGVWTHLANTGGDNENDRLAVSVGGNFTLGANASIDLYNRGFSGGRGPGGGSGGSRSSLTASHGGLGAENPEDSTTYGFITRPVSLGSGGTGSSSIGNRGGGALFLRVTGDAQLDGILMADGKNGGYSTSNPRLNRYVHGSGGSIFVQAANISGSGDVRASLRLIGWRDEPTRIQHAYRSSGGGRIALIATNSADFAGLTFNVDPHPNPDTHEWEHDGRIGAAGTVYLRAPTSQRLVIDQNNLLEMSPYSRTQLPATLVEYDILPGIGGELEDTDLVITNGAWAALTRDLRMNDLEWLSENSTLDLNGLDLYFKADEPAGFPEELSEGGDDPVVIPESLGGGTVTPNGGRILWGNQPYLANLFIWAGSNATVDNYDPEGDYEHGSSLTVTAIPDTGYDFIRWIGNIDEAQAFNPEITVTVSNMALRAVVAASAGQDIRTWIATGNNNLASTPENWYPQGTPQTGEHIVLDETGYSELTWDLEIVDIFDRWEDWIYHSVDLDWDIDDIVPASWTQTGYYTAEVTFRTRYPDVDGPGTFDVFEVAGDVAVNGGVWTHPQNSGDTEATDRLAVAAGGNFTLGTNAIIDVDGRGFAQSRGPGAGTSGYRDANPSSASHGGAGARNPETSATYGSVMEPLMLGSGAWSPGGGALFLTAAGAAVIDGTISAEPINTRTSDRNRYTMGSGGSIYVRAQTVSGSGIVRASANERIPTFYASGGGRIALIGLETADFDGLTVHAHTHPNASWHSGGQGEGRAGTVYLESGGFGRIIVDQDHIGYMAAGKDNYTDIPAILDPGNTRFNDAVLELRNGAFVRLTAPDLRVRDLELPADSTLYLDGHDLHIRRLEPAEDFPGTVVKDGGEIIWLYRGSLLIVR